MPFKTVYSRTPEGQRIIDGEAEIDDPSRLPHLLCSDGTMSAEEISEACREELGAACIALSALERSGLVVLERRDVDDLAALSGDAASVAKLSGPLTAESIAQLRASAKSRSAREAAAKTAGLVGSKNSGAFELGGAFTSWNSASDPLAGLDSMELPAFGGDIFKNAAARSAEAQPSSSFIRKKKKSGFSVKSSAFGAPSEPASLPNTFGPGESEGLAALQDQTAALFKEGSKIESDHINEMLAGLSSKTEAAQSEIRSQLDDPVADLPSPKLNLIGPAEDRKAAASRDARTKAKRKALAVKVGAGLAVLAVVGAGAFFFANSGLALTPATCAASARSWVPGAASFESCRADASSLRASKIVLADGAFHADIGEAAVSLAAALSGTFSPSSAKIIGAQFTADFFLALADAKALPFSDIAVAFENATVFFGSQSISGLSGSAKLGRDGRVDSLELTSPSGLSMKIHPAKAATKFEASVKASAFDFLGTLGVVSMDVSGTLSKDGAKIAQASLVWPKGSIVRASGSVGWGGQWIVDSSFESSNGEIQDFIPWLSKEGRMAFSGTYKAESSTFEGLLSKAALRLAGKMRNADLNLDFSGLLAGAPIPEVTSRVSEAEFQASFDGSAFELRLPSVGTGVGNASARISKPLGATSFSGEALVSAAGASAKSSGFEFDESKNRIFIRR